MLLGRMKAALTALSALLLLAFHVSAQPSVPRIALVPLKPIAVPESDAAAFTTLLEVALVKTQAFDVMAQNQIDVILSAQELSLLDFMDEVTAARLGRILAAQQIVHGTISATGGRYFLAAKLIDVTTGRTLRADTVLSDSLSGLTSSVESLAMKLAGSGAPAMDPTRSAPKVVENGSGTLQLQLGVATPDMLLVQGGAFQMGDTFGNGGVNEKPAHTVMVSSFLMAKTEVTFDQYDRFCDETGRGKPSDQGWGRRSRPVINVSWFEAAAYCNWLSRKEGLTVFYAISGGTDVSLNWAANGYRLPTEAEWEYAARGGRASRGTEYAGSASPEGAAWYAANSGNKTQPVGGKAPNELGLYDMSGNVRERCNDWYGSYTEGMQTDPRGPEKGQWRVERGGSWRDYDVRAAVRSFYGEPANRSSFVGFRPVRRP